MPIYVYQSNSSPVAIADQALSITTAGPDKAGPRLRFQQQHSEWVFIEKAGVAKDADSEKPGIRTHKQMQCMAVIAAKFGPNGWSAHLAHVSHPAHSLLAKVPKDKDTYMAIGGKASSADAMRTIANTFEQHVKHIWIYVGGDDSPDFGMNKDGYFGETSNWP